MTIGVKCADAGARARASAVCYTPAAMSFATSPRPPACHRRRDARVLFPTLLLLAACGEPSADRPPDVYTVRGVVRQLPSALANELHVRHEAIADFRDADGEVVGMESMTMPFPLADAALTAGVEPGDKVEMVFEVRWDGGHPLRITALEDSEIVLVDAAMGERPMISQSGAYS